MPGRRADDREARFDALYEAHRQTLHAYFLGRTGDPDLALDVLQETFMRAWRNLDLLLGLPEARQRAWLFAIGRNLVIDQYRGRAARMATHDALTTAAQMATPAAESAEQAVERAGELRLVEAAIGRLPEDLRTVLVLHVLGERTSAEIGALLGRPAGTIRYQLSRARKRLAEELARLEAAPLPTLPRDPSITTAPRPPLPREGEGDPVHDRRHERV